MVSRLIQKREVGTLYLCCRNSVTFSLYYIVNSIVCLDPTGSSNVNDYHCAADNRFNNIHFRSSGGMVKRKLI